MRGTRAGLLALDDFGSLKELLYLFFGKGRIVRSRRRERKQEAGNNH
jgi:hypothetical protein